MYLSFDTKFPLNNFIQKQEILIRFWLKYQLTFITIAMALTSLSVIGSIKYLFTSVVIVMTLFLLFVSIASIKRTYRIKRLYSKAIEIINLHKSVELKKRFRRGKRLLIFSIIVETLLPVIPVCFVFKLLFFKNFDRIKKLIKLDD